jgi:hypothetical protein
MIKISRVWLFQKSGVAEVLEVNGELRNYGIQLKVRKCGKD